jgi:tight adherence protein C
MNALLTLATPILTFLAVILWVACIGLGGYALYKLYVRRLLRELEEERRRAAGDPRAAEKNPLLQWLGHVNERFVLPRYADRIQKSLISAGEPKDLTPFELVGLQEVSAVVVWLAAFLVARMLKTSLWWTPFLAAGGWFYPLIWLRDRVKARHLQISRAMPYNLDLMTLSVEAGLDFAAGLGKVVEKGKPGPFTYELSLVLKQLKLGKTREEALRIMADRVRLPALSSFVSSLIQADKIGASLGKVLRIQSTQMRLERSQRAEKLANEAPVKMLFPLVVCIFPCVMLLIFGTIILQFLTGNG